MLLLLALLAVSPATPRHCQPEGVYRATAGFFTRFDGERHWETSSTAKGPALIHGPYFIESERIRFKIEGAAETPYDWFATFSPDCGSFVLAYEHGGQADIHFERVK
jgi:hypothetical protein